MSAIKLLKAELDSAKALACSDAYQAERVHRLLEALADIEELMGAISQYRCHFTDNGCPDPSCQTCVKSLAAEERLNAISSKFEWTA